MTPANEVVLDMVTGYECSECGERFNAAAALIGSVFCPRCGKVQVFTALEEKDQHESD